MLVIITLSLAAVAQAANPPLTTSAPVAPMLTTVVVNGSTVYGPPQLFSAYRDQLGQPISRDSARAVVDAIIALYERDGYVKPEIALDDSLTGRGVLRVQVHEAQISRVTFEGDTERHRGEFARIANALEQSRPLRREQVPQALRELRQLAGVTVTASTRRDTVVRNAFELVVKAEFSPVDGVVRMNNRGTDQVGPAFMMGQFYLNGVGSQGKLGLMWAAATDTDEYLGGGLYFDTAIGAGSRLSTLFFTSHSAPNEAPVNLEDEYDRERATVRLWHPLHQEGTTTFALSVAFDAEDLSIDSEGVEIRDDRLRIIEGGLRASWRGANATQYSTNLLLRKGLDALGAGLQAADLADDPRRVDFLVTQFTASIYRRFATDWSARLDVMSQFSPYVLPDSERFKIGGDRLGRGFEVAEIAGDRGLGGKIELRRDLLNTEGMFGRLSTYGFYDIGAAWKQDLPGRESAATAGLGFALQGAAFIGYCEVAAPLTGPDIEGKNDASVFAELSYRF
ncbi:MAG TPA: ShlB/FhaC/HecB family hemolysin secretion/activation protein [Steroidobacteraceae bacterium]|nr:ShlB/FhaC/HecB family hemolysin secretion/activation protein [Steroidobacteraceae bacterium]